MSIELASVRYWGLNKDRDKPVTFLTPLHPQYKHYATGEATSIEDVALCDKIERTDLDPVMVSIHNLDWATRKIMRMYLDDDVCDQHTIVEDMPVEWKPPPEDARTYTEVVEATREKMVEDIAIPKELIK